MCFVFCFSKTGLHLWIYRLRAYFSFLVSCWRPSPNLKVHLTQLLLFFNRLQPGAILNIHKFFRVLAKPLTWVIYYSVVHLTANSILTTCANFTFDKNANINLASVGSPFGTQKRKEKKRKLLFFSSDSVGDLLLHPGANLFWGGHHPLWIWGPHCGSVEKEHHRIQRERIL